MHLQNTSRNAPKSIGDQLRSDARKNFRGSDAASQEASQVNRPPIRRCKAPKIIWGRNAGEEHAGTQGCLLQGV